MPARAVQPGDSYTVVYATISDFFRPATAEEPVTNEHSNVTMDRVFTCSKADGTKTTWNVKVSDVKTKSDGSLATQASVAAHAEKGKSETWERDERNRILASIPYSPIEFEFPVQAVQVGDAWRTSTQVQGYALVMTYTVAGFEKVDGMDAIVVTGTHEGTPEVEMVKPVKTYYDVATGFPIRGEGSYLMHPTSDSKLSVSFSMKRK